MEKSFTTLSVKPTKVKVESLESWL